MTHEDSKVYDRAEQTQKEMHAYIKETIAHNPKLSYEAVQATFFLLKIAKLELEIENLKKK